jgi:hypothetical protein
MIHWHGNAQMIIKGIGVPNPSQLHSIVGASLIMLLALAAPASAQWLKYKTPGIPRTADGKPNLSAPAPKMADGRPDFSGLWRTDTKGMAETGQAEDRVKLQAWAVALTDKRKETIGRDAPSVLCLPAGPVIDMGVGKIVQTQKEMLMLFNGTLYREIFLDGRPLPTDPNPDWMGYSVGHWKGNTLVIETIGFNDRTWLDDDGRPHTEQLHVTERLRRTDFGHMELIRTMVDPGALQEPWTVPVKLELNADTEQLEYVCNENERDHDHLVGKASDDKGIAVARDILAAYVGSYAFKFPATGEVFTLNFVMPADQLMLSGMGPTVTLSAISNTEFSAPGVTLKFEKNDSGAVTDVMISAVEGEFKAARN